MKEIKYDAENKALGRVSSEVARILMDKDNVNFAPNVVFDGAVEVFNLDKVQLREKKMIASKYYRHSGYIGNLKESTMKELWEKDYRKFFINMVKNMLPDNKLRSIRLKKIKIK